ncbi:MAG: hypothetical protein Kow0090_18830 [Myxococcota bacterium]
MFFSATELANGKVIIAGGAYLQGWEKAQKSVEIFDPETETFFPLTDMREKRSGHVAIALENGLIALVGGDSHKNANSMTIELYDPQKGAPVGEPVPLSYYRRYFSATLLPTGKIAVIGGTKPGSGLARGGNDVIEIFDPKTNKTDIAGKLPVGLSCHQAIIHQNQLLLIGGIPTFSDIFILNYENWEATKHSSGMLAGREDHRLTVLNEGKLFISGGSMLASHSTAEICDMEKGCRILQSKMSAQREDHTQTMLDNGKILIVGGEDNGDGLGKRDIVHKSADIFDPETERFCPLGEIAEKRGRDDHQALKLDDGRVLILGGEDDDGAVLNTAEFFIPTKL